MKLALRVVDAIAGDPPIEEELTNQEAQDAPASSDAQASPDGPESADGKRPPAAEWPPAEKRDRTRWLPWQRRTPSWEAAYNTACVYAALDLDHKVIISLQRAINNPDCEMQRPSDWISHDPDLRRLKSSSKEFEHFLDAQQRKDYPPADTHHPMNAGGKRMVRAAMCQAAHLRRYMLSSAVEQVNS